jgi:hypothetical protein
LGSFPSKLGYKERGFEGRRAFIHAAQDKCIIPSEQERVIVESGVSFIEKAVDASHSPFVSVPMELAKVIDELANEFAAAR